MVALRKWAKYIARTPLHPQWLLGDSGRTGNWVRANATGMVLDIGCADRWIKRWLSPECSYFGLDYPATGRELYGACPDVFADASNLPFSDSSIDTVVILEVMEHLRHPQKALTEIARILRPKGRVLLSMPFLYPVHDSPHDYQRLTIHGLKRDLETAGFRVDEVSTVLGSAETAGLIVNLAIGGMAIRAFERRSAGMLLIPLFALAVPVVNLVAWMTGLILPSWEAITSGYRVSAGSSRATPE